MVNATFCVMDKVIWVRAMLESVNQDCDDNGAHEYNCALKPLSILNTGSITTFLPTPLSTCLN